MQLVLPSAKYKDSFIEAVKEFQADEDYTHRTKRYHDLSVSDLEKDFDSFVEKIRSHAEGKNLPKGFVPESEFWLIDDGEFIGRASVRHRLAGRLHFIGGHIGIDVRPSKRKKGYGNNIFELVLQKAKELGLKRVLITADERNVASQKIIERNRGVFENAVENDERGFEGFKALRYWIDLK